MQYIHQLLILFILINCLQKLSFWQWWQAAIFGLLCAVFVVVTCRWAILQSKTQLADFLADVRVMQDTAVLVTIESAVCFAYCFGELREMFGRKKGRWQRHLLHWYPGLLMFPVLFYLQTQLIFAMPGTDFTTLSYLFAALVLTGLPLLAYALKLLCPEREFRLEIHFLAGLFVCLTGLIATVNGNVTYAAAEEPLNIQALLLSASLFALFFIAGILVNKYKWKIKK